MFTIEEICEEQERQYNQLMQEDDQYCHPESFKWGFEHGFEYALTKLGWHPASELPLLDKNGNSEPIVVICENHGRLSIPKYAYVAGGVYTEHNVKYWCYPPKEE